MVVKIQILIFFSLLFATLCQIREPYSLQNIPQEPLVHAELDYIADSKFSYVNTSLWNEKYPICAGKSQSPIEIVPKMCKKLPKGQTSLKITNAEYRPERVEVLNDHYTIKYLVTWQKDYHPVIAIDAVGDGKNSYIPREIHFHWGRNNTHGSEHVVHSRKYSMEMHIVCYNVKYKSVSHAKFHKDGIVVLGQFFQATPTTAAPKYFFLDNLPRVQKDKSKIVIDRNLCHYNLGEFLNVKALEESFVVYSGSFTTPPCYENVTWIVGLNVNAIRSRDVNLFRNVQGLNGPIVDNCRPIQSNSLRKCYTNM